MKPSLIIFVVICTQYACTPTKLFYNDIPVINANSDYTEYRIGEDWYRGQWSIAPEIENDTLSVICYQDKVGFEFRTDSDKIKLEISPNTSKRFYVRLNKNEYAHTIIQGIAFQPNQIRFDDSENLEINIKYQTGSSDFLDQLSKEFPLDFINDKMNDTELVLSVLNWVNSRWDHNGNSSPSKNDAITILNEAKQGSQFPCFAYAIVLRDQLNSLGYKARTVYLKTQDAKLRLGPPGHVATEVYLNDLQKWVFLDGQFNIMPMLNGIPLNAVEFQNAINNHYSEFELLSLAKKKNTKNQYIDFVYDYLFYFDTSLDNRYGVAQKHTIRNKNSIMLVPIGADNLNHIDFWDMDVDYCIYTSSLNVYYAKPN